MGKRLSNLDDSNVFSEGARWQLERDVKSRDIFIVVIFVCLKKEAVCLLMGMTQ